MRFPQGDARSGGALAVPAAPRSRALTHWTAALPKALLGAAMVLAGTGSLLSAGGAQAANNYSCVPRTVGGPGGFVNLAFSAIGVGDTVSCADKQWTINGFDFGGNIGDIDFEWVQVDPRPGYSDDLFSQDLHFSPSIIGPQTGFFDYTLQITQPGWAFDSVQFDSAVAVNPISPGSTTVIKAITGGPTLTSTDGGHVGPISLAGGTSLTAHDSWIVAQGDVVSHVKDTYSQRPDVPGPLPLVGAGMAFGWSRKLRSRVRAAGLA